MALALEHLRRIEAASEAQPLPSDVSRTIPSEDDLVTSCRSFLSSHSTRHPKYFDVQALLFSLLLKSSTFSEAEKILSSLASAFPGSRRVKRMESQWHFYKNNVGKSFEILSGLLADDPADLVTRKQLVSVIKKKEGRKKAIGALLDLLDVYPIDCESWMELCALYEEEGLLEQAAFCMEELILLRPVHSMFLLHYADILVKLGSIEQAKKYYTQVLDVSLDHAHALYGIKQCLTTMRKEKKLSEQDEELLSLASDRLRVAYSKQKRLLEQHVVEAIEQAKWHE